MKLVFTSIVAASALAAAAFATLGTLATQVTISGSSTVFPVVEKASKEFTKASPDVTFAVGQGGSGAGITSVGKGEVQIGMASRNLKEKESKEYPDIVATKIGLDGVALVVSASNGVGALTKQQLQDVFTGKVTNWKDLGGSDQAIALISPHKDHGTFEVFAEYVGVEANQTGEGAARVLNFGVKGSGEFSSVAVATNDTHKATLASVMTKPNTLGIAPIGAAQELITKGAKIKVLTIDGVEGTLANVANGTYPMSRPLLVLTKGAPSGAAKDFIAYLTGEAGQKIVKSLDYIPLTSPK